MFSGALASWREASHFVCVQVRLWISKSNVFVLVSARAAAGFFGIGANGSRVFCFCFGRRQWQPHSLFV
jgi:hypothetical protein